MNSPGWVSLLPEGLQKLSPLEREKELHRLMATLPKDSPQRRAIKIFLNSRYGTRGG